MDADAFGPRPAEGGACLDGVKEDIAELGRSGMRRAALRWAAMVSFKEDLAACGTRGFEVVSAGPTLAVKAFEALGLLWSFSNSCFDFASSVDMILEFISDHTMHQNVG